MQVSGLEVHHESKKPLQWDLDLDSVTDFGWRKGRPISSPSLIVTTNRPMIDQLLATTITIDPIQPSTWTTDNLDHHQSPAGRPRCDQKAARSYWYWHKRTIITDQTTTTKYMENDAQSATPLL